MVFTKRQVSEIFAEWDRQYRESPETFMSEVAHLLHNTATTYGELCGTFFLALAKQLRD